MGLKLAIRGHTYYLRGSIAGTRIYESTRTGNRQAADTLRIRREAEILERHVSGRRASITFAEAALTYMESGGEGRFLEPILTYFGPKFRLADVNNEASNQCARVLYPNQAPSTINRQIITPISAVVNMAAYDNLCAHRRFRRRKVDNVRLRWLTPKEAEALISAADQATALKILFLLGTGARSGEIFALMRRNLHIESGEAFLEKTKNGDARMISFPDRVARALRLANLPEEGAIFLTPKRHAYKLRTNGGGQMRAAFNRARDGAGLGPEVTPHVLRHTWATWFYAQTKDFGGLMDFGGWKKADMANRYRKVAPQSLASELFAYGWNFIGDPAPQELVLAKPNLAGI